MYIIPHTKEMVAQALQKAKKLGKLKNSITKGRGNAAGYLGEEAVAKYLNANIMSNDEGSQKYNHDLILQDGRRAEVKTKRRTVPPLDHYDVSIAQTSLHQKPDVYIFVSLEFKESKRLGKNMVYKHLQNVWLLGEKTPKDFLDQSNKWNTGDIDKSNNFITKTNMYNLPINLLDDIKV